MSTSTSSYLSVATAAYERAASNPTLQLAQLEQVDKDSPPSWSLLVSSTWCQDAPAAKKKVSFSRTHWWDRERGVLRPCSGPQPLPDDWIEETRGDLRVLFAKEKDTEGKDIELLHVFKGGAIRVRMMIKN